MTSRSPIHRRTLLRGTGALLALPFLEAMAPKTLRAAAADPAPLRLAYVFFPNGAVMSDWTPTQQGADFKLPRTLEPLAKVRDKIMVLSGLAQDNARPKGDGAGDHARSAAAFLTGAHPTKTDGADIRVGISADQVAANQIGSLTRLPSLELGTERGRNAGQCDSGYSCAYSNNISWKSATQPMSKEIHPKEVFERMFGRPGEAAERKRRDALRLSILDVVADDAEQLSSKLGQVDRRKLDEYFSSVREIEQRIERSAADAEERPVPELSLPRDIPNDIDEHVKLMYDLMALAFRTDTTRVVTFMLANEGSNRSYPAIGVNDGHHHLSHHQGKEDWIRQLQQIDLCFMKHFAKFLENLRGISEGESNLLERSLIVYGGAIGDGNAHNHDNLPILLAGGAGGRVQSGRHIDYGKEVPLNNLYLTMLDYVGVHVDRIGDSTGRLPNLDS